LPAPRRDRTAASRVGQGAIVAVAAPFPAARLLAGSCWIGAVECDPTRRVVVCSDGHGGQIAERTLSGVRTFWRSTIRQELCAARSLTGVAWDR